MGDDGVQPARNPLLLAEALPNGSHASLPYRDPVVGSERAMPCRRAK